MLYDNALLARAYLHGFQVSGDEELRRTCCDTLDWTLREMRGPEGGFYSALDADSEGVEGQLLRLDARRAARRAGRPGRRRDRLVRRDRAGNFEGANVLEAPGRCPTAATRSRAPVRGARAARAPGPRRQAPGLVERADAGALAEAGAVLERDRLPGRRGGCAEFLVAELRDERGRLLRTWKDGRARLDGYLEDHAFRVEALLVLYEATFEPAGSPRRARSRTS
jgi:uncharacterized protein YyaL (SSP411 family)